MAWFDEPKVSNERYLFTIWCERSKNFESYQIKGEERGRQGDICKHFLRQFKADDNVEMKGISNERPSGEFICGPSRPHMYQVNIWVLRADYDKLCTDESVHFICSTDLQEKEDFLDVIEIMSED